MDTILSAIRNENPVKPVELDKLHSYVQHKKTIVGFVLLLIETVNNSLISWWKTETHKQG